MVVQLPTGAPLGVRAKDTSSASTKNISGLQTSRSHSIDAKVCFAWWCAGSMGKAIGQAAPRHSGSAAGTSKAHRPANGQGWAWFKAGTEHSKHTEKAARSASGLKVIFKLNGKVITTRIYTRTKTGDAMLHNRA